jgi:hypothetical protein
MAEEEDKDMLPLTAILKRSKNVRIFKWNVDERLNWEEEKKRLIHATRASSIRCLRMTPVAFDRLVEILRPDIEVNETMSRVSTPDTNVHIYPELIVVIGIRYLAGGSYHDISGYCGVSDASFYRVINLFVDAELTSEAIELQMLFPKNIAECKELANRWAAKSLLLGVIRGCIMVLDSRRVA